MQDARNSDMALWAMATNWLDDAALSRFCVRCCDERPDLDTTSFHKPVAHEQYGGLKKRVLAFMWGGWLTFGDAEVFVTDDMLELFCEECLSSFASVASEVLDKTATVAGVVTRLMAAVRALRQTTAEMKLDPAKLELDSTQAPLVVCVVDANGWVSSIGLNQ